MTSLDTFDPLASVVDWLDACRSGDLDALLDLYDEQATLDCFCENVTLTGRKSIAAYRRPKLEGKLRLAFSLDELVMIGDSVQVDYRGYEGNPLRIFFYFSPSGRILHTTHKLQGGRDVGSLVLLTPLPDLRPNIKNAAATVCSGSSKCKIRVAAL